MLLSTVIVCFPNTLTLYPTLFSNSGSPLDLTVNIMLGTSDHNGIVKWKTNDALKVNARKHKVSILQTTLSLGDNRISDLA